MGIYEVCWFWKKTDGPFTIYFPWKIEDCIHGELKMVRAAIRATSIEHAQNQVYDSYKMRPNIVEFLSCVEREENWDPFKDEYVNYSWVNWL